MNNNNISLQKSETDKLITMIEMYLDELKEYRKQLDKDFIKGRNDMMILDIGYSISGKLKHLGIICRSKMISFEKTIITYFWKKK